MAEPGNWERLGDRLPAHLQRAGSRASSGGFWTPTTGFYGPSRVFGLRSIGCDLANTPLVGHVGNIGIVVDDRAGNLWYQVRGRAFVERGGAGAVKAEVEPSSTPGTVTLRSGHEEASALRIFWRLEGGPWRGGQVGPEAQVRLPGSGSATLEVMALNAHGAPSPIETLTVSAD